MAKRICIPEKEYQARVKKAAALAAKRGLDSCKAALEVLGAD